MKIIKYFFEFIFIIPIFIIFKIIGYKNATNLGEIIGKKFGPLFRSNYKIQKNNKIFWPKIQNILLNDLITKVKRSNN